MGRIFGTDGARGVAITELTCELAMQIGRAAALVLTKEAKSRCDTVGCDSNARCCLSGAFDGSRCRRDDFCIS